MVKVFGVFDVKAAAFGTPMFVSTVGLALRAFTDACSNPSSPLAQHCGDYALYQLGEYDAVSGRLVSEEKPVFLYSAAQIADQLRATRGVKVGQAIEVVEAA